MKSIKLIITLYFISYTYSQTCMTVVPQSEQDCTKYNDNKELCCFLTAPNLNIDSKLCYSLPMSSFAGETTIYYRGHSYLLNCGIKKDKTSLPICGPSSPLSRKDCMTGSTFSNSCCLDKDNKRCVWLGTKFVGETEWAGLNLDCSGENYRISIFILIAIVSIIFS